ncbi:MAG: hypothetical protein ACJA0N_002495 [Pseudohongiellaceae bacterium]|jgi:hypothetical protein
MICLACLLNLLGAITLSLSKKRHRKDVLPKYKVLSVGKVRSLIFIGFALLLASTLIFIENKSLGLGLVYAFGWLTVAGLSLAVLLSYQPQWSLRLFIGVTFLTLLTLLFAT